MLEYLILNSKFEAAKQYKSSDKKSMTEKLLQLFQEGDRQQFISLFCLLRRQSKLQFYLRVYFLIYSIHPFLKSQKLIPEKQKLAFKEYLDTKGSQLAKEDEFLEFYAFPFIKKPLEHQKFKNLFKREWIQNLKQKLIKFLTDQDRRMKGQIKKIFSNAQKSDGIGIQSQRQKQMQKINNKLFEQVKQFTQKYHMMEESQKQMIQGFHANMLQSQSKWFQITKQLVNCSKGLIHMLISSQSAYLTDRKFVKIKKRIQKYDKFVSKRFDDLIGQSQDISIFDKPSINQLSYSIAPYTQKNFTPLMGVEEYLPTDYHKMKAHFKRCQNHQKIPILNGLYWRIVRSKDKHVRRLNIIGIFKDDFLGLHSGDLDQLLASRQLMKPALRLLQMISLDSYGRRMLFVNNHLHRDFVGLIHQCDDQDSLEYVIHILGQICSLKKLKLDLINLGIIEICMDMLRKGKYQKNQLILQNISAILLNMLEKEEAYSKYEKQEDLFEILMKYAQTPFKIIRAFIYGIIYSLLWNQQLFYRAHRQKLDEFLDHTLETDPNINKKQLLIIREKMYDFQPKQKEEDGDISDDQYDESEDDEFDVDEEEIPDLEEMISYHQDIVQRFGFKGNEARRQTKQVKDIFAEFKQNRHLPRFSHQKNSLEVAPKSSSQEHLFPKIIQSPKNVGINQTPETPYIKQQKSAQKQIPRKKDNYIAGNEERKNYFRVKEKEPQRPITRQRQQRENSQRLRKSKSAERGIGITSRQKQLKQNYESSRPSTQGQNKNKVSQFKSGNYDKNYRSPQSMKKPREEVLKQLNDQLKAQQKHKEKRRVSTAQPRENQPSSHLIYQTEEKEPPSEAFQSKPKLRRTPPKD